MKRHCKVRGRCSTEWVETPGHRRSSVSRMRKSILIGLVLAGGIATEASADSAALRNTPRNCKADDAPYKNYNCLDEYLGGGFFERLINYYRLEWGREAPPADPKAPPGRRDGWPATPLSIPPFPFTEWPYGAATALGVSRPSSNDSPLMVALSNTALGKAMSENNIQMYGW